MQDQNKPVDVIDKDTIQMVIAMFGLQTLISLNTFQVRGTGLIIYIVVYVAAWIFAHKCNLFKSNIKRIITEQSNKYDIIKLFAFLGWMLTLAVNYFYIIPNLGISSIFYLFQIIAVFMALLYVYTSVRMNIID